MTSPSSTPPDPAPAWLSTWQPGSSEQTPAGPDREDIARGRKLALTARVLYPLVLLGAGLLAFRDTVRPWAGLAGLALLIIAAGVWLVPFLQALAAVRAAKRSTSTRRL